MPPGLFYRAFLHERSSASPLSIAVQSRFAFLRILSSCYQRTKKSDLVTTNRVGAEYESVEWGLGILCILLF